MTNLILFLYFSVLMLLNCKANIRATGEYSLYARHVRFSLQMAVLGIRWLPSYSALVFTVGSMLFGIALPIILLLMLRERLSR